MIREQKLRFLVEMEECDKIKCEITGAELKIKLLRPRLEFLQKRLAKR